MIRGIGTKAGIGLACALLIMGMAGCGTLKVRPRRDPPYVVLLNNSGDDLFNVTAREVAQRDDQPTRLASVTPLLAGHSYSVRRQPGSQPLTHLIRLSWEHRHGGPASAVLSIESVMAETTGNPGEALVVAILPGGNATAFLAPVDRFDP